VIVSGLRRFAIAFGAALLASCTAIPDSAPPPVPAPIPTPAPAPVAYHAISAGLSAGPDVAVLFGDPAVRAGAEAARRSFIESCPRLLARTDQSGVNADWSAACAAAPAWSGTPVDFFRQYFEAGRVGTGSAFLTGYYEPQIAGVRERQAGYDVPVYGIPSDLVRDPNWTGEGRAPLGKVMPDGSFAPYDERAQIVAGSLDTSGSVGASQTGSSNQLPAADGRAPVIGWARDAIDFFFLQIQGSGQLIGPDGEVLRIGYAGQNGREYVAIGRILRDRGVFQPGEATMAKIVEWLRANPAEANEVMNQNKSWVFFKELTGEGPLGALGVPVRPRASVAADPAFVPLGAPVWIDAAHDEADGLWIAQDTGGAIKGANRFDTFWGAGPDAARIAGGMSSDASAYVLLPKGTLARITAP